MNYIGRRKKRGSVTAFSAALGVALLVLGVGFIFLVLYMGGQRETKNATDAGALNVGKQAIDQISVPLMPSENQLCFLDCTTDSTNNSKTVDPTINLRRINRVWAKAMLMAINADAASDDGNAGSGVSNANSARQGAQDLSDRLSEKLTTASNLHGFFRDLSKANSVRMIGSASTTEVLPGSGWTTSLMDRDAESNITLAGTPSDRFFLPPGYNLSSSCTTKCTRNPVPGEATNIYFLKGYAPLQVGSNTFWQVPFKWDDKPHLVSSTPFNAAKATAKPLNWDKAVPNAFSVEGQAQKTGALGEKASSWVLSNPRQPFKLAAPHSFLHVKVDEMQVRWYYYVPLRVEMGARRTYGFIPETMTGTPAPAAGILCATVNPPPQEAGLDVVGNTVDDVIFGRPYGNTSRVEAYMVNRCNEMISKPGVTISASKMHSVLSDPLTIAELIADEKDFYIYSEDGQSLVCQSKTRVLATAPVWMKILVSKEPDGSETKLIDDATMPGGFPLPHVPTPDPFCSPTPGVNLSLLMWDKDVYWKPGTGYNGSLGDIRVKRWSEIHTVGICNPL